VEIFSLEIQSADFIELCFCQTDRESVARAERERSVSIVGDITAF
jgi:hypothetical protein